MTGIFKRYVAVSLYCDIGTVSEKKKSYHFAVRSIEVIEFSIPI